MSRLHLRAVLLCTVLVASVGCSDEKTSGTESASTTSTTTPPSTPERGPVVAGEITLQGAIEDSGPVSVVFPRVDDRLNTCAKVATGTDNTYLIPLPNSVGRRQFTWQAIIRSYKGPAMYTLSDLGPFTVEVVEKPGTKPVAFVAGPDTTASLEVKPDNSGSLEFSGLVAGRRKLAGSLTWSCR